MEIAYDPNNAGQVYLILKKEWNVFRLTENCKQYVGVSETEYTMARETEKVKHRELRNLETEGRLKFIKEVQKIVNDKDCKEKDKVSHAAMKSNQKKEEM